MVALDSEDQFPLILDKGKVIINEQPINDYYGKDIQIKAT